MHRHDFELAGLQIRPARNVIDDGRSEHPLEPLVMDLLCTLAERPEQVFTRDELLDRLWPGRHGADASLTRAISLLRKGLRDAGGDEGLVETVPKRGYRLTAMPGAPINPTPGKLGPTGPLQGRRLQIGLIASVALVGMLALVWLLPLSQRQGPSTADPTASRHSVAVLPFAIFSDSPDSAFFADAIHDELLSELSRFRSLRVISRTSVLPYRDSTLSLPEIATALGVDHVVEGAVQHTDGAIRVNVQLIDARDDSHLWARAYDRKLSAANLFDIQTDIARSIASAMKARLSVSETQRLAHRPTNNLEAYQAYLVGRQHFHRRTIEGVAALDRANQQFERALSLQANYPEALAGLASVHAVYPGYVTEKSEQRSFDNARVYAERALELDAELSQPHAVLGLVETDTSQRMRHFQRAIELEPNNATALTWWALSQLVAGFVEEGEATLLEARRLDPTSAVVTQWLQAAADLAGATDRFLTYGKQGMAMDLPPALGMIGMHLYRQGDIDGARALFQKSLPPEERQAWMDTVFELPQHPELRDAALSAIEGPAEGIGMSHLRVLFFLVLDEQQRALDLMERRLPHDINAFAYVWRKGDPELRRSEAFERMARQLGLPEYWRQHGFPPGCRPLPNDHFECQ